MDWHAPTESAWQQAKERQTPVLLLLEAAWCPHSKRFREQVLDAPPIAARLAEQFVCMRVDQAEHPGLDRRYAGSGWPTLALVSAAGEPLDQCGPVAQEALLELLDEWSQGRAKTTADPVQGLAPISDQVMQRLLASADPKYGGWGSRQKFPHPEALHFALVRWSREGAAQTLGLVTNTLNHMQAGAIHDPVDGGFYRYARTSDWGHPQFQKMLGSNAQRMLAYAEAYQALGTASYKATALGIHAWMLRTLLDESTGAFRASQDEDTEYYHLNSAAARAQRTAPATDPWLYMDRNCDAVCALLKAGVAFDEPAMHEQALSTLDFLIDKLYRPGKGAYHYWDGKANLTGILADQAALLRAMTWAMHSTGTRQYLNVAVELAQFTLRAHGEQAGGAQSPADGSLVDHLHDVQARGSVGERSDNLRANAQFAEALLRLSAMAQNSMLQKELRQAAQRILGAFQTDWPSFGSAIADYGRAVDLLVHEPVQITIVGPKHGALTQQLRRSALAPYIASRVVQCLDPAEDSIESQAENGTGLQWAGPDTAQAGEAIAYLHQAGQCYARTSDPQRLPALMARLG